MHIVGQIIEKNLHRRPACTSALWINPDRNDNWQAAQKTCDGLKLFCQDFSSYRDLKQAGAEVEFAALPAAGSQKYDWVILNLPRQKALLAMLLDCIASLLTDDGVLWLAGENKAGIKSADKLLKQHFEQVSKLDNARHCSLFEARSSLQKNPFDHRVYQQQWKLNCQDSELLVTSYPGVFAHGRLDAGTALLLEALTAMQIQGEVLDFACGAGVIGACVAAKHSNSKVTLLDSSALALMATKETLAINQLTASVQPSDGLSEVQARYDFIITNPPIHAGVRTDNLLSHRLLASVGEHINPGGQLIMVANRHLPYEKWLLQQFRYCEELLSNSQFKVIAAQRNS